MTVENISQSISTKVIVQARIKLTILDQQFDTTGPSTFQVCLCAHPISKLILISHEIAKKKLSKTALYQKGLALCLLDNFACFSVI